MIDANLIMAGDEENHSDTNKSISAKESRRTALNSNDSLRNQVIIDYAPFVKWVAQTLSKNLPPNIDLDDLFEAGIIGLLDAFDKYDPRYGNGFKTYAEIRIRGAILDEIRHQDWVPRSVRKTNKQIARARAELEQLLLRPPTNKEISEHLNISMAVFQKKTGRCEISIHSLEEPISNENLIPEEYFQLEVSDHEIFKALNVTPIKSEQTFDAYWIADEINHKPLKISEKLYATLENRNSKNPYSMLNAKGVRDAILMAVERLAVREKLVLSLYYYENLNLKEIGRILDLTESRISQLHSKAVAKLRAELKNILYESE